MISNLLPSLQELPSSQQELLLQELPSSQQELLPFPSFLLSLQELPLLQPWCNILAVSLGIMYRDLIACFNVCEGLLIFACHYSGLVIG